MHLSLITIVLSVMARHSDAAEEAKKVSDSQTIDWDNYQPPLARRVFGADDRPGPLIASLVGDDIVNFAQTSIHSKDTVDKHFTVNVNSEGELKAAITKYSSEPGIKYIKYNGKPLMIVKGYSPTLPSVKYTGQYDLIETDDWVWFHIGFQLNKVTGEVYFTDDFQGMSPSTVVKQNRDEFTLYEIGERGKLSLIKKITRDDCIAWKTQFHSDDDEHQSNPGNILCYAKDGRLIQLDFTELPEKQIFIEDHHKESEVQSVWFSRDSSTMIQVCQMEKNEGTILNVFDTQNGKLKQSVVMVDELEDVAINSDNQWALAETESGSVLLIDLNTGLITEIIQSGQLSHAIWLESDLFMIYFREHKLTVLRDVIAPMTDIPFEIKGGYFEGIGPTYHYDHTTKHLTKMIWEKQDD